MEKGSMDMRRDKLSYVLGRSGSWVGGSNAWYVWVYGDDGTDVGVVRWRRDEGWRMTRELPKWLAWNCGITVQ